MVHLGKILLISASCIFIAEGPMKKTLLSVTYVFTVFASFHAHAAPQLEGEEALPSYLHDAIFNGSPVESSHDISKSTYQLVLSSTKYPNFKFPSCTATLISKHVLLTAAHCINQGPEVEISVKYISAAGTSERMKIVQVKLHEEYASKMENTGSVTFHDIALVKIDQPIPGSMVALLPPQGWKLHAAGEGVIVAGYGNNGRERTKEEIENDPETIALVEKAKLNPPKTDEEMADLVATLMSIAAKRPLLQTKSKARLEGSGDRQKMVLTVGKSVCSGDSGGPSYVRSQKGRLIVMGVHSTSSNAKCLESVAGVGYDTYVPTYVDWIGKNVKILTSTQGI